MTKWVLSLALFLSGAFSGANDKLCGDIFLPYSSVAREAFVLKAGQVLSDSDRYNIRTLLGRPRLRREDWMQALEIYLDARLRDLPSSIRARVKREVLLLKPEFNDDELILNHLKISLPTVFANTALPYIAGAQAKRAAEIDEVLSLFKTADLKEFAPDDPISSTALVEIELNNKNTFLFVMPKGGGVSIKFEGKPVQVITPQSVLGGALLGLKAGDLADIEINNSNREYSILSVY